MALSSCKSWLLGIAVSPEVAQECCKLIPSPDTMAPRFELHQVIKALYQGSYSTYIYCIWCMMVFYLWMYREYIRGPLKDFAIRNPEVNVSTLLRQQKHPYMVAKYSKSIRLAGSYTDLNCSYCECFALSHIKRFFFPSFFCLTHIRNSKKWCSKWKTDRSAVT